MTDRLASSSGAHAEQALAVIPARFGSSRFPGKPLAAETGHPLIWHVWQQAQAAHRVGRVVVATDDDRIHRAVLGFGGESVLTAADHPNGTSRIAEVIQRHEFPHHELVVNVQGDEPEVDPAVIDTLIETLLVDDAAPMATLASPFRDGEDPTDPNIVKLVRDRAGRAMYFSRSLIPFPREAAGLTVLKHPGLYAYRRGFLLHYVALEPTPLEQAEQLEQLRALEHGYPIAVGITEVAHHGIDTPQQYEAFVRRWQRAVVASQA